MFYLAGIAFINYCRQINDSSGAGLPFFPRRNRNSVKRNLCSFVHRVNIINIVILDAVDLIQEVRENSAYLLIRIRNIIPRLTAAALTMHGDSDSFVAFSIYCPISTIPFYIEGGRATFV